MKKSLARRWNPLAVLLSLVLLLSLVGCGGSGSSADGMAAADREAAYDSGYYYDDYDFAVEAEEAGYGSGAYYGGDYKSNSSASSAQMISAPTAPVPEDGDGSDPTMPRKLIRRASLTMETTTFDESAAALSDLVNSMGGYFSDASAGDQGGSRKRANYTIRVPAKQFDAFLSAVGDICHETWRDVTQDDISERYYDTQGRLRTQNTKLSRLQELLLKAEDMEDIITIQGAISETEERIEELQGTLNHWDNQVDYATISLTLTEVYRLSNTPPVPETYITRLGSAFTEGITDFFEWVGDLIISLAYSWLWWLLLVLIVLAVLRFRKSKWWRKKMEERAARAAARQRNHRFVPYVGGPFGHKDSTQTPAQGEPEKDEKPEKDDKPEKDEKPEA